MIKKTCILFGIYTDELSQSSFDELVELTKTFGLEVISTINQKIKEINGSTFIGKGKLEELALLREEHKPDYVIFDCELSPLQQRNIQREIRCDVMDRTYLILEIFAHRAHSKEGKIQVELAQMMYLQNRLTGHGIELSRLGAGIGTRGPGESKLEGDRRRIKERISVLKKELQQLSSSRHTMSKLRRKNKIPHIAIVGYTNAGKSTLLNLLSGADVFTEDKLFATLDPTTRKLILPNNKTTVITDTVGFIRKLPHNLIESFKSTFEGIKDADLLLHVINLSEPNFTNQCDSVFEVLEEIGIKNIPILNVYNKIDLVDDKTIFLKHKRLMPFIDISALNNINIDKLVEQVQTMLESNWFILDIDLNNTPSDKLQAIMKLGKVLKNEESQTNEDKNNNSAIIQIEFHIDLKDKVNKILA